MIFERGQVDRIREILKKQHLAFLVRVVGSDHLSQDQRRDAIRLGVEMTQKESLLSLVYRNNRINDLAGEGGPQTVSAMRAQQKNAGPTTPAQISTEDNLNATFTHHVEKLHAEKASRVEGVLREYNTTATAESLIGKQTPPSVASVRARLQEATGDANRNMQRIAVTEVANAVGLGSMDHVLSSTVGTSPTEVMVYRLSVVDAALCLSVEEMVLDSFGAPVPVGSLREGDMIMSASGSPARVTSVKARTTQVTKFSLKAGISIVCTPDHPVLVRSTTPGVQPEKPMLLFVPMSRLERAYHAFTLATKDSLTKDDLRLLKHVPSFVKKCGFDDVFYFMRSVFEECEDGVRSGLSAKDLLLRRNPKPLTLIEARTLSSWLRLWGLNVEGSSSFRRGDFVTSKRSAGKRTVVEIEMDQNSDRTYVQPSGVVSHNCSTCRTFYNDRDGTPAVYRLSTIVGNGSNYGKKKPMWRPVVGATHPHDRESGILELKPGWKVLAGGKLEYIGLARWSEYIAKKVRS